VASFVGRVVREELGGTERDEPFHDGVLDRESAREVRARIAETWQVDLEHDDLVQFSTPAALAERIIRLRNERSSLWTSDEEKR
jgi:hypothetical protein